MQTEIWIAVISLFGTITGSFAGIMVANKLVNFRLEKLEEEVKKLNNLSERVTMAEYEVHRLTECLAHPHKAPIIQQTSIQ